MTPDRGRTNWLVVMSKAPRMGNVKTRLAKDIGMGEALRFYKTNTRDLLRRVGSTLDDCDCRGARRRSA